MALNKEHVWQITVTDHKKRRGRENFDRVHYKPCLGNVSSLDEIVHVEEQVDRHSKLEEIVDDFLHPLLGLHAVVGQGALLFAEGRGATFEYDLLDDPENRKSDIWNIGLLED